MSEKIYQGGSLELREVMAPDFLKWDFSRWEIKVSGYTLFRQMLGNDINMVSHSGCQFRLKPETIKIGDREVPKPVEQWEDSYTSGVYVRRTSADSGWYEQFFGHTSEEGAQAHYEALVAVSKGEK